MSVHVGHAQLPCCSAASAAAATASGGTQLRCCACTGQAYMGHHRAAFHVA